MSTEHLLESSDTNVTSATAPAAKRNTSLAMVTDHHLFVKVSAIFRALFTTLAFVIFHPFTTLVVALGVPLFLTLFLRLTTSLLPGFAFQAVTVLLFAAALGRDTPRVPRGHDLVFAGLYAFGGLRMFIQYDHLPVFSSHSA